MKKQLLKFSLGFAVLAMTFGSCSKTNDENEPNNNQPAEEFLAPTTPKNRVAVLEDFTGVRCVYCPDGHVRAQMIKDADPDKFIIIATHGGGYASPAPGWNNFTTIYADQLIAQSKLTGYPAGTMSRIKAEELGATPMTSGGYAMGRGYWSTAATAVMNMAAPVNLGAKATFDPTSRQLTVKVDLYYTTGETVSNSLNVALLQDKIIGKQITPQTGSAGDPNYIQNNVLRNYLTNQWGEVISDATTTGSKVTRTYTYTVPEYFNGSDPVTGGKAVVIDDLKVVAFVTRGKTEILNAVEVDVK